MEEPVALPSRVTQSSASNVTHINNVVGTWLVVCLPIHHPSIYPLLSSVYMYFPLCFTGLIHTVHI